MSSNTNTIPLDGSLVRNGRHRLRRVLGDRDGVCLPRENVDTLQRDTLALLFCSGMCIMVALHPVQELLPAFRVPHVLDTEVHPLLDVAVADDLVDNDTDSVGGDVVDDSSPSVVVFVRHTLLLGGVCLDIDDVTDAVVNEVRRQFNGAMVLEAPLEHVARTRTVTE